MHTGLTMSYDKTLIYRIGSLANTDAKLYTTRKIKWTNNPINTLGIDLYQNADELDKNYEKIMHKLATVSEMWFYRNLTLIGKIQIINTLMASLFVYKMQALPLISDKIVKKVEEAFNTFLWKNSKPKMKISTLQKEKHFGGLGLVDIRKKHLALLINWIKIAKTNKEIWVLARNHFGDYMENDFIWKCNISPDDVKLNFKEGFWKNVLYAWSTINYQCPQNDDNILEQIIWLNSNIKIDKKVIKPTPGLPKELKVKNIVNENHEMLNYQSFCIKYPNTVSWLKHCSMVCAIPEYWKIVIKNQCDLNDDYINYYEELDGNLPSKRIYHILNNDEGELIASARKWARKLPNLRSDVHQHLNAFKDLYKCTISSKLRNFQYRLLHNKIFCNDVLFHWKIKDSQKCDWCEYPKQNICHLLYECKIVNPLWGKIRSSMELLSDGNLDVNLSNIIYNKIHAKASHAVNCIVLVTKFTIYRCKINGTIPTPQMMKNEIKLYIDMEYFIALRNHKLKKHREKWSPEIIFAIDNL